MKAVGKTLLDLVLLISFVREITSMYCILNATDRTVN